MLDVKLDSEGHYHDKYGNWIPKKIVEKGYYDLWGDEI